MAFSIEEIKRRKWLKLERPFNCAGNLEVNDKYEGEVVNRIINRSELNQ